MRVGDLHRELVRELALAIRRKTRVCLGPGFGILVARDNADADTARGAIGRPPAVVGWWLWVFHWRRAELARGLCAGLGRSGKQHLRAQIGRQGWRQLQVADFVVTALEAERIGAAQQALDDARVFDQARVALVVRRAVIERFEILL